MASGKLAPGFTRWPNVQIWRDGILRWKWVLRDGLAGPVVVGPGKARTRFGARRAAARALREATGERS